MGAQKRATSRAQAREGKKTRMSPKPRENFVAVAVRCKSPDADLGEVFEQILKTVKKKSLRQLRNEHIDGVCVACPTVSAADGRGATAEDTALLVCFVS
jgi:hypothetical protein